MTNAYCQVDINSILATKADVSTDGTYVSSKCVESLSNRIDKLELLKPDVPVETKSTVTSNGKSITVTTYKDGYKQSTKTLLPEIKDVQVYNNNTVVVEFVDGTKEKAVLHQDDQFSIEYGISICVTKKIIGGSSIYNKVIDHVIKVMNKNEKDREAKAAAKEARAIRAKKAHEKKEKRKNAKINEAIEIQKEAYIRAMIEMEKRKNAD